MEIDTNTNGFCCVLNSTENTITTPLAGVFDLAEICALVDIILTEKSYSVSIRNDELESCISIIPFYPTF